MFIFHEDFKNSLDMALKFKNCVHVFVDWKNGYRLFPVGIVEAHIHPSPPASFQERNRVPMLFEIKGCFPPKKSSTAGLSIWPLHFDIECRVNIANRPGIFCLKKEVKKPDFSRWANDALQVCYTIK